VAGLSDGALAGRLREGASILGIALPETAIPPLLRHVELLLKWNRTINLTAITDPAEVVEKHVLDSLAIAALVPAGTLLDAGSGGGFPGIPVRLVRPDVEVLLVDSVGKKVAFLKNLLAELSLPGLKARSLRLSGNPVADGIPPVDAAVARAFASPADWLSLAAPYVRTGGRILCMAGPRDTMPASVGRGRLEQLLEYELPFSRAGRRAGLYLVG
jgi:16S rRNA (guanine527-N7)-methyltransferase